MTRMECRRDNCHQTNKQTNSQTWNTVSPWSSGILRNDSSSSRDTDDSMVNSQWESVSCKRLNCSKCLTISANDCMEVERRRQTLLHSVLIEDTCFLMRSESYWSADFESSSALLVILSSCGLRSSISLALACWNRSTHLVSGNIIYLKLNSLTWIFPQSSQYSSNYVLGEQFSCRNRQCRQTNIRAYFRAQ